MIGKIRTQHQRCTTNQRWTRKKLKWVTEFFKPLQLTQFRYYKENSVITNQTFKNKVEKPNESFLDARVIIVLWNSLINNSYATRQTQMYKLTKLNWTTRNQKRKTKRKDNLIASKQQSSYFQTQARVLHSSNVHENQNIPGKEKTQRKGEI